MDSDQKRAFLAVALSAVVLFGWQIYFAPEKSAEKPSESKVVESNEKAPQQPNTNEVVRQVIVDEAPVDEAKALETIELKNGSHRVVLNGRLEIVDFNNPNAFLNFEGMTGEKKDVYIEAAYEGGSWKPLALNLTKQSEYSVMGSDPFWGVQFSGNLDENGKFNFSLQSQKPLFYRFVLKSKEISENRLKKRRFLYFTTDLKHTNLGSDDETQGKVKWIGLDYNYHLLAILFPEKIESRISVSEAGRFVDSFANSTNELKGSILFTKKGYDHLTTLGDNLNRSIDFGFFGILAVPLLRALQFIHKYVPNYGIAIILLTLSIRLLTFPLQFKSFKSMKKMQKVQPEMQKLREKYKDDPQRMQQETMALFKRAGANPLGGCLPMVLQMPIFFAFYQLLANAVELVGANFAFHITDLSTKDPYYVLPALMGIAMFGQMKLNPSTSADPTQQKVMTFMPIIFTFFMKDLPAGLNLYFFFSTLFGIAQQLFVYKTVD